MAQGRDIVCIQEEPMAPTRWPLARITEVHPGQDGKVRVVTIKTAKGVYTRPVVKLVPFLQDQDNKCREVLAGGMSAPGQEEIN